MKTKSNAGKSERKPPSAWRRGCVADARALGVTYPHLWKVLEGKRKSASLMKRYRELQARKKKGGRS